MTFFFISYYNISSELHMAPDSQLFSLWADDLIKRNFNLYNYYAQNNYIVSNFFYTVPVFIIAVFKFFFGSGWQFAFFILNLVLVLFSIIIFTKSLLILGVRSILVSLTMPLIAISVDLLTWPRFILTEMIFTFLVILVTYIVIKGIIRNKYNYLLLFFVTVLILISRPTSLPIIFAIVSFVTISGFQIFNKPKIILLIVFPLFIFTSFMLALVYYFIQFNFSDNTQLLFLSQMVKDGMIIHDRPETWVASPTKFFDVVHIYFLRLLNFFNPYAESFSIIHIILNSLQIFFILISIVIWSFLNDNIKSVNKTIVFILIVSYSVATFHAFTLIDYDWRYRFPIILPLIMIFSMSMEITLKKISRNWSLN
ncbi:oligosaccharide repeat unit polymerase [Candidatus Pelagibacter sp.]|nr:oligosaccharide repeat unit polymerase [Candidatus Pelagibacter sp.]